MPYDIPLPACIPAFQNKSSAEFTLVATSLVRSIGKAVGTTFTGKLTDQVTFKCTARRQLESAARRLSGATGSATVEVPLPVSLVASTLPGAVGDTTTQSTLAVAAIRMNALFSSTSETADVFAVLRTATGASIPSAPITVQVSPAFVASTPGLGAALAAAVVPAASATTSDSSGNMALAALVIIPAALFGLVAWYCRRPAEVTSKVQGSWAPEEGASAVEASNIAHVNPMPQTVRPPLILGDSALEGGGTRV